MRGWIAAAAALLAAAPAVAQEQIWQDDPARLQAAINDMRAEMLRPGDQVENWDRGGADPDGEVRRRGPDRFYMVSRSSTNGTSVNIITDRPIADFAPAGWRIVDSYGQAGERLAGAQLAFQPYSPRYVVGVRIDFNRVNDVTCYRNFSHALLFEIPGAPASPQDDMAPILFRLMILALEDQTICVRAEGDPERGYTSRYFMPDGHALPALGDPTERTMIVPAAPVDRLLVPPAPEPSSTS